MSCNEIALSAKIDCISYTFMESVSKMAAMAFLPCGPWFFPFWGLHFSQNCFETEKNVVNTMKS
jgi:hypothetical protein